MHYLSTLQALPGNQRGAGNDRGVSTASWAYCPSGASWAFC